MRTRAAFSSSVQRGRSGTRASRSEKFSSERRSSSSKHGAEAELAVEPERARLDALLVAVAQLIRVNREDARAEQLAEESQDARVNPGRLALAEGVEEVESGLDALERRECLGVAAGHAVLEDQLRVVGERREPSARRHAPEEDFDAAPGVRTPNRARVAVR